MPKPTLHFEILRRIAETASGRRYEDLYFVLTEGKEPGSVRMTVETGAGAPRHDPDEALVIHCAPWPKPGVAQVSAAKIESGNTHIDLLSVNVPAHDGYPPVNGVAADAVFWSASAVEKFLVPYYASVYGDAAPEVVNKLVSIFVPPGSPERGGNGDVHAGEQDPYFAVIHLPSSEYADNFTPDGFAAVTTGGKVHWV